MERLIEKGMEGNKGKHSTTVSKQEGKLFIKIRGNFVTSLLLDGNRITFGNP